METWRSRSIHSTNFDTGWSERSAARTRFLTPRKARRMSVVQEAVWTAESVRVLWETERERGLHPS